MKNFEKIIEYDFDNQTYTIYSMFNYLKTLSGFCIVRGDCPSEFSIVLDDKYHMINNIIYSLEYQEYGEGYRFGIKKLKKLKALI